MSIVLNVKVMAKKKKNKRMGRPVGSGKPAEKTRKLVATRLDDGERKRCQTAATMLDEKLSDFIRTASLERADRVIDG